MRLALSLQYTCDGMLRSTKGYCSSVFVDLLDELAASLCYSSHDHADTLCLQLGLHTLFQRSCKDPIAVKM